VACLHQNRRDYQIEVTETESGDVEFSRHFLVPPARQAKRREVLRDWYIGQAKEKILTRAEQHARKLGVKFKAAKIVDNRYRWGCPCRKPQYFLRSLGLQNCWSNSPSQC
jgi:predicted metal-dependent hydrolase